MTLFLFCEAADKSQLTVLKLLLYCFELASDLKINFSKSFLRVSEDTGELHKNTTALMNCQIASSITYFGKPLRDLVNCSCLINS